MKTLLTIFTTLFLLSVQGQTADAFTAIDNDEVPNAVLKKYTKMHANTPAMEWRVEGNTYEAKYKSVDNIMYDRFNSEGLYLETRILKDWDSQASKSLKSAKEKTTYKYWEVIEFYVATTAADDMYYIIQLKNDDNSLQTIYFDESGKLKDKSKSGY